MSKAPLSTLWPEGFEPENTSHFVAAAIVDEVNAAAPARRLHSHATGQLCVALEGAVGLQTEEGLSMVPVSCGIWLPAGTRHNGVLGPGGRSLYCHFSPEAAKRLPAAPARLMLNRMTVEMIRHLATAKMSEERARRIGAVLLDELELARELPVSFAAFPNHPVLQRIALDCSADAAETRTNAEWAAEIGMSERSLSRLVVNETGMSFREWRLHVRMLSTLSGFAHGLTVEEAAYRTGYKTTSAFIRAFRQRFGMTPGALREEMQE
ncbi:helix-turn-helix transcriptional regulator [Sutterella sp.]|uniref:AraC family transcriptional regulator n=1 Tax=Sutterella sp. TaxID=1981025 RepID=UPI0026DF500C|nr:helix-turn-helix transcriptional regulator [Sutterella sp.]MDO5532951.1 helix-turn-helix transcriptional regulator [Sutterella sp.]